MTNFRLFHIDDNFRFEKNGRKLSKWVENTVGKGEIAHYEQFLLFPQCFQKACFPGASKGVIVWEWVKAFANNKINVTEKLKFVLERIENIEGKGKNAGCQHVFLLPQRLPIGIFPRFGKEWRQTTSIFSFYFNGTRDVR